MKTTLLKASFEYRLTSEMNTGGKLRHKMRRKKEGRAMGALAVAQHLDRSRLEPGRKVTVCFCRWFGPGCRMFDDDNLGPAFKSIRDGVCDTLGIDDGDRARIEFCYDQQSYRNYRQPNGRKAGHNWKHFVEITLEYRDGN